MLSDPVSMLSLGRFVFNQLRTVVIYCKKVLCYELMQDPGSFDFLKIVNSTCILYRTTHFAQWDSKTVVLAPLSLFTACSRSYQKYWSSANQDRVSSTFLIFFSVFIREGQSKKYPYLKFIPEWKKINCTKAMKEGQTNTMQLSVEFSVKYKQLKVPRSTNCQLPHLVEIQLVSYCMTQMVFKQKDHKN